MKDCSGGGFNSFVVNNCRRFCGYDHSLGAGTPGTAGNSTNITNIGNTFTYYDKYILALLVRGIYYIIGCNVINWRYKCDNTLMITLGYEIKLVIGCIYI